MKTINPKTSAMPLVQGGNFGWDGLEESLFGYDLGPIVKTFHGFSAPAFEKAVADTICSLTSDYGQPTTYNAEKDVYEQPEEPGSKVMAEVGVPALYETVDGTKKLYSFEDSGWTWMRDEE